MSKITRVDPHLGDPNWVGKLSLRYFDKENVYTKIIPFFENPTIKESQTPRYANYAPIGRSSNLFGYLGADSRKFEVTFNLTLPHMTHLGYDSIHVFTTAVTPEQMKGEILNGAQKGAAGGMFGAAMGAMAGAAVAAVKASAPAAEKISGGGGVAKELDDQYIETLLEDEAGLNSFLSLRSPIYNPSSPGAQDRRRIINMVASIVAAIRSTVINNTQNTRFGPPMVRLDWGILYRDVPCVCKGYNIVAVEKGGFDKRTLLPRMLKVTMALEEARNLSNAESSMDGDGLVGWEILLGSDSIPGLTMDPGNFKTAEVAAAKKVGRGIVRDMAGKSGRGKHNE